MHWHSIWLQLGQHLDLSIVVLLLLLPSLYDTLLHFALVLRACVLAHVQSISVQLDDRLINDVRFLISFCRTLSLGQIKLLFLALYHVSFAELGLREEVEDFEDLKFFVLIVPSLPLHERNLVGFRTFNALMCLIAGLTSAFFVFIIKVSTWTHHARSLVYFEDRFRRSVVLLLCWSCDRALFLVIGTYWQFFLGVLFLIEADLERFGYLGYVSSRFFNFTELAWSHLVFFSVPIFC